MENCSDRILNTHDIGKFGEKLSNHLNFSNRQDNFMCNILFLCILWLLRQWS